MPWGVGDQLHEMINSLKNNLYFPTNMNIKKYLLKLTTLLLVENIDHRPVNYCLWAKSILLPVFMHKVLFEHSQPGCFHIARDCSHAITTEFCNTAEKSYNPQRLKYLLPGPLQKRLADPWHSKSKSLPETMHANSPIASSYQKPDCANIFLSGLCVQKVGLAPEFWLPAPSEPGSPPCSVGRTYFSALSSALLLLNPLRPDYLLVFVGWSSMYIICGKKLGLNKQISSMYSLHIYSLSSRISCLHVCFYLDRTLRDADHVTRCFAHRTYPIHAQGPLLLLFSFVYLVAS